MWDFARELRLVVEAQARVLVLGEDRRDDLEREWFAELEVADALDAALAAFAELALDLVATPDDHTVPSGT